MINHRWANENADLGTAPIPIEPCFSSDHYEQERTQIFKKTWLLIGRAEDVANTGDYFVQDLPIAETSILVARGRDGGIRAFHNMCTHRGNKLVWDRKGCTRGFFVCPFHSWGFDATGALRTVTDEDNFFDLDKSELGLAAVACEVWGGFIFVNLDPAPRQTLGDYLDGVAGELKDYPFAEMRLAFGYTIDEQVNWKVLLDAQNEVYHAPYLHAAGRGADNFADNEQNAVRMLAFRRFGRHSMYATAPNPDQFVTPTEQFVYRTGQGAFAGDAAMVGNFDFYVVFPNTVIALLPGGIVVNYRLWPLGPERTSCEVHIYMRSARNAGEALGVELLKTVIRDTLQEDAAGHERVQSMLKSGATKHFVLQDEEVQIRFFHKMVEQHVAGAMV